MLLDNEKYMCPALGISGSEWVVFADLNTPGRLRTSGQRDDLLRDLAAYGKDENEISAYLTAHLGLCKSCRMIYEDEAAFSVDIKDRLSIFKPSTGIV